MALEPSLSTTRRVVYDDTNDIRADLPPPILSSKGAVGDLLLTIIGVCYDTLLGQSLMIFCTIFPTVK